MVTKRKPKNLAESAEKVRKALEKGSNAIKSLDKPKSKPATKKPAARMKPAGTIRQKSIGKGSSARARNRVSSAKPKSRKKK